MVAEELAQHDVIQPNIARPVTLLGRRPRSAVTGGHQMQPPLAIITIRKEPRFASCRPEFDQLARESRRQSSAFNLAESSAGFEATCELKGLSLLGGCSHAFSEATRSSSAGIS